MDRLKYLQRVYKNGISGSTLKIIAIVTMVIDHIGSIIFESILVQRGILELTAATADSFLEANMVLYTTYMVFRTIGRISFPIFCFLTVQGFLHTHNIKKYLLRMLLFAFISEIPFDIVFSNSLMNWEFQNIFFTLLLGIITMRGIQIAEQKENWNMIGRIVFGAFSIALGLIAAKYLKADYGIDGILAIIIMYVFRRWQTISAGLGSIPLTMGRIAPVFSMIPIHLYNGKKGRDIKWLFYWFYPAHILLLHFIYLLFF